ncbi:hypothetical protein [Streptomyces tateyamensis]|nr:hypothetical protein [Streptomyces tateyamensis]
MRFDRQLRGWSTGEITWRAAVDSCPAARQAAWPTALRQPRRRTVLEEPVTIGQVLGLLALTD